MKYQFYAIIFDVAGNQVNSKSISSPLSITSAIQLVTSVSINPSSAQTKNIGETFTITPTVGPSNANNKNVNWTSSNTNVATVSKASTSSGTAITVTCKATGTATITATAADGSNNNVSLDLTVINPLTSVALNKSEVGLTLNGTTTITATTTPNDADSDLLIWTTSDSSVAAISVSGKTATITGKKLGTATITVQSKDDSSIKATCKVNIGTLITQISSSNYGDYVNYPVSITAPDNKIGGTLATGGTETPKTDWRIFYKDSTYVYLIAANYLPNNKVPTTAIPGKSGSYSAYWSSYPSATITTSYQQYFLFNKLSTVSTSHGGYNAIKTLLDTSKWTSFVNNTYAVAAIGAPTIEMFCESWNSIYTSQKIYYNSTSSGYKYGNTTSCSQTGDWSISSYSGCGNTLYFPHRGLWNSCYGYWMVAPSSRSGFPMVTINYGGSFDTLQCSTNGGYNGLVSARPVIAIKSTVCAAKDANGIWQLSN